MSRKRNAVMPSESEDVTKELRKARSPTWDFIREVKSKHYVAVIKDQCQGLTVALAKIFGLGFENIKVNVQNLIYLFQ
jgi:hypothetical protein